MKRFLLLILLAFSVIIGCVDEKSGNPVTVSKGVPVKDCGPEPTNKPTPNGFWDCNASTGKWTWVPDIGRKQGDTIIIDTIPRAQY